MLFYSEKSVSWKRFGKTARRRQVAEVLNAELFIRDFEKLLILKPIETQIIYRYTLNTPAKEAPKSAGRGDGTHDLCPAG